MFVLGVVVEKEELYKAVEIMQDVAKEAGVSQDELVAMVQALTIEIQPRVKVGAEGASEALREIMKKVYEKWNMNN